MAVILIVTTWYGDFLSSIWRVSCPPALTSPHRLHVCFLFGFAEDDKHIGSDFSVSLSLVPPSAISRNSKAWALILCRVCQSSRPGVFKLLHAAPSWLLFKVAFSLGTLKIKNIYTVVYCTYWCLIIILEHWQIFKVARLKSSEIHSFSFCWCS